MSVTLFFSYSPPPNSSPTTTDPRPKESILSRFSVDFKSRLEIDSKSTEKRHEIDSLRRVPVVVGHESGEYGL